MMMKKQLTLGILAASLSLALCLAGCTARDGGTAPPGGESAGQTAGEQGPAGPSASSAAFDYAAVLTQCSDKITAEGAETSSVRGALYDLDGDGVDELLLCYECPEASLSLETWTRRNGQAVPLMARTGSGYLAGSGSGGLQLASYQGKDYLCCWSFNTEALIDGSARTYRCWAWAFQDGALDSTAEPLAFEAKVIRTDASTVEWANGFAGSLSEAECQKLIQSLILEPTRVLCRAVGEGDAVGMTLPELRDAVSSSAVPQTAAQRYLAQTPPETLVHTFWKAAYLDFDTESGFDSPADISPWELLCVALCCDELDVERWYEAQTRIYRVPVSEIRKTLDLYFEGYDLNVGQLSETLEYDEQEDVLLLTAMPAGLGGGNATLEYLGGRAAAEDTVEVSFDSGGVGTVLITARTDGEHVKFLSCVKNRENAYGS